MARELSANIVGSGPAAFYVAQRLLRLVPGVRVRFLEKDAEPFGLVRYGVAPDHAAAKVRAARCDL